MSGSTGSATHTGRWQQAWPDALAFAGGLALAWYAGWATTDLVWSLWLSSLLVGYAMIVWSLFAPAVLYRRDGRPGAAAAAVVGGLFMLAFFTIHFGMFHLVHSIFLNAFFPVGPKVSGLFNAALYAEVFSRYWYFVPLALLAERQAFRLDPLPPAPPVATGSADDLAVRRARATVPTTARGMTAPYKNVVRLHLLIFFFAAAHFARLDSFLVYAVVYAVYFFPWRLVFGEKAATPAG